MDPASKMADLKHTPDAVRSLMVVYSAGQEAAMKRLRNHQGFVTLNNKPTEAEFLKMLADFDIAKLTDAQALGFGKILKGFDVKEGVAKSGYAHRTSHGATHEFFDIHKYADEIAEIQFRKEIKADGFEIPLIRVYDYVLKDGWHVDKKAWKPESIEKWFKASAKGNVIVKGSAKTGQLFRDIIAAHGNTKIRWSFDARASVIGKEKIFNMLSEALNENLDSIAGTLGKTIDSKELRASFIEDITKKLKSNFDIEISDI